MSPPTFAELLPFRQTSEDLPKPQPVSLGELIDVGLGLSILIGLSVLVLLLTRMIFMPLLRRVIKRTRFEWDDVFLDADTFRWLSFIPPAVVFCLAAAILESDLVPIDLKLRDSVIQVLQNVAYGFIVVCILQATNASLTAVNTIYSKREAAKGRPIKGFIQLAKIFVAITGSICAVALLFGEEPWEFLKYTAGMTAVLLFVFKDTILSLVASVQLTTNNMIKVGDWIEVPGCGADGDVIDIALHTVKVRNFDKTIVTVPTRKLVDGSFRNWWGMQESGGRRIMRNLNLDLSTVRFLEQEDIDRLSKIQLLTGYLAAKQHDLDQSNRDRDTAANPLNSRRLTNLGTFRAYVAAYLKSLSGIHEGFTFLVRTLQPDQTGIPMQIYVFANTTNWIEYETIQADILDHLLAAVGEFDLRVFQEPSGHDLAQFAG